jgi:putative transposase
MLIKIVCRHVDFGRPMQNCFMEYFNGRCRCGVLDINVFRNLTEVKEQAERRVTDYNNEVTRAASTGSSTPSSEFRTTRRSVV